jgi:uncharacterized membrane protein YgcG
MTDDLGFDPADTEVARRLGSVAPDTGDTDAVLAGLRPRLTRARRRRQAGFVAIGTLAFVLLAGVVFAATDPGPGSKVRVPPADRPTLPVDTVPPPTTPTVPTTTSDGRATVPTSPSTGPATAPTTAPSSPPTTVDDHGGNRGPNPGSGSSGSGSSGSGSGSGGSGKG